MKNKFWGIREFLLITAFALLIIPIGFDWLLSKWIDSVIKNELYNGTFKGFLLAIFFTASVYYIALKPYQFSWKVVGVRLFKKHDWKSILIWSIIHLFVGIVYVIILEISGFGSSNTKTASLKENQTLLAVGVAFLSAAVISPIYEEIFYRGFIYKWLRGRLGVWLSMTASSLIFMLVHIPVYNTLPLNFIGGMIFAWLYEKTGSILPGIIVHGGFNGLAVIITAYL